MHDARSLASDLRRAGLPDRGVILIHSGFRALGPVEGGPEAVIAALRSAAPEATLAAPTFTTDRIDPGTWPSPPPPEQREALMRQIRPFDPATSPPHKMGAIATALWRTPGALRSRHPVTSWAALGPEAEALLADHDLDDPEGLGGPVGRAWQRDARILLLGVDHDADTTVHLAESLLEMPHLLTLPDRWPDDSGPERIWRPIRKTTKCSDGFVAIRPLLDPCTRTGRVGDAEALLLRSRDVVRVAAELLAERPAALLCDDPGCVHCPTSRRALSGWRPTRPLPEP